MLVQFDETLAHQRIQGAAYETVPQRLPFEYESLGKQQVKGFEEPVLAYVVTLKYSGKIPVPEPTVESVEVLFERAKSRWLTVGGVTLLIIGVGALSA